MDWLTGRESPTYKKYSRWTEDDRDRNGVRDQSMQSKGVSLSRVIEQARTCYAFPPDVAGEAADVDKKSLVPKVVAVQDSERQEHSVVEKWKHVLQVLTSAHIRRDLSRSNRQPLGVNMEKSVA